MQRIHRAITECIEATFQRSRLVGLTSYRCWLHRRTLQTSRKVQKRKNMKPYIKITKTYIKSAFLLIDLFDPETSEQIQVSYDHILHKKMAGIYLLSVA